MSTEYKLCACPLDCFDVCSMRAEIIDGKVTKLEGNKEHPITQGFICEKGRKHVERMYSSKRIKHPLKNVNGQFVEISWDEALHIITEKLKHAIKNYGTLSIAQYNDGGAGGLLKNIENLFFDYLGDVTLFKGNLCWGAGIAAQRCDFGDVRGHSPNDIYNAKTIIIWGRNPAETNLHLVPFLKKAREQGAKIILIDPIVTATAALSDWHIQLKPNGDAAFAMAAVKYIIENERYNKTFVERSTQGFDQVRAYIESMSYSELLQVCGADYEAVVSFTEDLLNRPSTIFIGYGVQRYNKGGLSVRAIDMLGAIAGIIGLPGGGINYANKVYGKYVHWDAVAPVKAPNHRYVAKPKFAVDLRQINNPKIEVLFISRSNPAVQLPDALAAIDTIKNIDFKVVLDYFMTDTAQLADIVLPVTYFMEETDIVYSSMWNSCIHYYDKLVNRYYEAKPEYEIYSLLAEKLGISDFPQMSEKQWIKRLLAEGLEQLGIDMDQLQSKNYAFPQHKEEIPWLDHKFETPSGKFELIDVEALKKYIGEQNGSKEYYFNLITVHTKHSLHSQHFIDIDNENPKVYLSKEDIDFINKLKLKDGDLVKLENPYGSINAKVSITDKCQKGVLYMKEGWWFKNGGSVNCLTPHELSDIGDQATYNQCRVKIVKLGVNNE